MSTSETPRGVLRTDGVEADKFKPLATWEFLHHSTVATALSEAPHP